MPRIPETQFTVSPQAAPSVRQSFDLGDPTQIGRSVSQLGGTVAQGALSLSAQADKLKVDTALTEYLQRSGESWKSLVSNRGLAAEGKNVEYTAGLDSAIEEIGSKLGDRQRDMFAREVARIRINQGTRADEYVRREFEPASVRATQASLSEAVNQVVTGAMTDAAGREKIEKDLSYLYELLGAQGEGGEGLREELRRSALSPLTESVVERKILAGNFGEARKYLDAHRDEMDGKTALRLEQQIVLDGALEERQTILDEIGKKFEGDWDAGIKYLREKYSGVQEKQLVQDAKVRQDEALRAKATAKIDTLKDYHLMLDAHDKDKTKPNPNQLSITEMYARGWSSDFVQDRLNAQQKAIEAPLSAAQAIDQYNALQIEIRQTLNDPELDQVEKSKRLSDLTTRAYAVQQIDEGLGSRLFTLIGQQLDRGASITDLQRHILWGKDTGLLHGLSEALKEANDPDGIWDPETRSLGVSKEERTRLSAAIVAEVERAVAANETWGYDEIKKFYDNFAAPAQARMLLKDWVRDGQVNLRREEFGPSDFTSPVPVILRDAGGSPASSLKQKASQ